MTTFAEFSKFKYVFLAVITILILISQYGLFITHHFYVSSKIDNKKTTLIATTTTTTMTSSKSITKETNKATAIKARTTMITGQIILTPKVYLVLLWTPYFSKYSDWPQIENLKCKYSNCELTHERGLIDASDAVLFHWRDIIVKDLPSDHNPNQIWIVMNQESPIHTPYNAILPLVGQINWTMTYRRDSDIYAPYGEIVKCDNSGSKVNNEFSSKTKNVAWIVSNCHTHSKREQYVRQLQKYIDVDIYGSCGKLVCKRQPSCLESIARNYKFYLSLENSICKDYVTEKLLNAAQYDIIPVVLGGADYSALMPHNSYIDAFNFSSPKQLAEYLLSIGSDEVKYNSYLMWKQSYCVRNTGWHMFCNMCERLNKNLGNNAQNTSLTDWWFRDGNCNNNVMTKYLK